jgi:DNA-binding NtrC family response regulator
VIDTPRVLILVVDDESDLAVTCARLLRRRGLDVVTAGSYETGRAALADARLALLVADLRLPDGEGLELVRAAGARRPPVPAIVMTGYVTAVNRAASLAAGAVAFLPKPFTAEAFARAVDAALEGRT